MHKMKWTRTSDVEYANGGERSVGGGARIGVDGWSAYPNTRLDGDDDERMEVSVCIMLNHCPFAQ